MSPDPTGPATLPTELRKEIFRAVVEAQDRGMTPAASRAAVADRFSVSEHQVREIEREGLDAQWPPL